MSDAQPPKPTRLPDAPANDTGKPEDSVKGMPANPDIELEFHPGARPVPEYTLISKLGEGGFGKVWKARDDDGFEIALKFLCLDHPAGTTEQRALEVMKNVRHPHLVTMFKSWRRGNWLILGLELGDETLLQRLDTVLQTGQAGIPLPQLMTYMHEAAKGLDFLHSRNIHHRDVKPQNMLLVGGSVKVADFGLARVLERTKASHSGGMSPAYAAPEVIRNLMSSQSDQYSLAVTYCQLRGGNLPFAGPLEAVLYGHLQAEPDLSMLPPEEQPAVRRALSKNPHERFPDCLAFVRSIHSASGSSVLLQVNPRDSQRDTIPHSSPQRPPGRRVPWYAAAGVIALVVLLAAVLAFNNLIPPEKNRRLNEEPIVAAGPARVVAPPPMIAKPPVTTERAVPKPDPPPPVPSLKLQPIKSVTLTPGSTISVPFQLERTNCPGRVDLEWKRLPAGVSASPEYLDEGADSGRFEFSAAADVRPADQQVLLFIRAGDTRGVSAFRLTVVVPIPNPIDSTGETGVSAADMQRAQAAWAAYLGRKVEETVEIDNGVKMTFVLVPPGKYLMGSPTGEAERSQAREEQHPVTLTKPFYLGKYEVTQSQYEALMGTNPSRFKANGADSRPVEQVSWVEAEDFATRLTKKLDDGCVYRLPTEAEWEYACRGGRPASQPFGIGSGTSLRAQQANFNGDFPYATAEKDASPEQTTPVGTFEANSLGLYDMHGNVWEWCADRYATYSTGGAVDPAGPATGEERVYRGGSWFNHAAFCRAAFRSGNEPEFRNYIVGFRLARSVPSGKK